MNYLIAILFLALFMSCSRFLSEKTEVTDVEVSTKVSDENMEIAQLMKLCKEKQNTLVSLVVFPLPNNGPCTQMACLGSCCNSCGAGTWKIKGTSIPALGQILPVCVENECGSFKSSSCKEVLANGILQNCGDMGSMRFSVQSIN